MTYYITYIQDSIGFNYLGIKIPNNTIDKYINELKKFEEDYEDFIDNQQKRDKGDYHITVINVAEYNKLSKNMGLSQFIKSLEYIFKYEINDIEMVGLGTASKNDNKAYFIVCKSDKIDAVRNRYGLEDKDLHITIGFNRKDVSGVPKNSIINI